MAGAPLYSSGIISPKDMAKLLFTVSRKHLLFAAEEYDTGVILFSKKKKQPIPNGCFFFGEGIFCFIWGVTKNYI